MSLHYLVKYERQETGDNLKYVLRLMINHEIVQPSISIMMGYFIINISFDNLLVKEFLKSVKVVKLRYLFN